MNLWIFTLSPASLSIAFCCELVHHEVSPSSDGRHSISDVPLSRTVRSVSLFTTNAPSVIYSVTVVTVVTACAVQLIRGLNERSAMGDRMVRLKQAYILIFITFHYITNASSSLEWVLIEIENSLKSFMSNFIVFIKGKFTSWLFISSSCFPY